MRTVCVARLAFLAMLAFAAAGCGGASAPEPPATAASGRPRIVSIPPNLAYSYATVDDSIADLVGLRADVPARFEQLLLGRVFPGIRNVPGVDGVEQILRVRPDAVFDWAYSTDEVGLMRAAGLPVVTFRNGETAFVTWPREEGRIAGVPLRAAALVRAYDARTAAVIRARGAHPVDEMPRVLLLSSIDPEIVGDVFPRAFALAGVRSTLSHRAALGLEAIVAMDPAFVLLIGDNATPAQLYSSTRWNVVPAVRARRVYEIPEEWPGSNGIVDEPFFGRWLAEIAYPERMPRALRAEIRRTYRSVFGFRVDDAQLDRVLRLGDNARSVGYLRRFGKPT